MILTVIYYSIYNIIEKYICIHKTINTFTMEVTITLVFYVTDILTSLVALPVTFVSALSSAMSTEVLPSVFTMFWSAPCCSNTIRGGEGVRGVYGTVALL